MTIGTEPHPVATVAGVDFYENSDPTKLFALIGGRMVETPWSEIPDMKQAIKDWLEGTLYDYDSSIANPF